jgi:hypothetical protein
LQPRHPIGSPPIRVASSGHGSGPGQSRLAAQRNSPTGSLILRGVVRWRQKKSCGCQASGTSVRLSATGSRPAATTRPTARRITGSSLFPFGPRGSDGVAQEFQLVRQGLRLFQVAWRRVTSAATSRITASTPEKHLRSPLGLVTFWRRYEGTLWSCRKVFLAEFRSLAAWYDVSDRNRRASLRRCANFAFRISLASLRGSSARPPRLRGRRSPLGPRGV